ncbi:MAG: cyclic nucleotide-binding domain-containing protein [Gemmatimonadetes bacterium]|nr:cyclic nucleotide-binding domain-containing protein [Gemmatimonadota bacterium]
MQIEIEGEPRVQAALLLALAACAEADAVDDLGRFIDDKAVDIAEAAMIGLLRSGGVDGILVAGERLLALERSTSTQDRIAAARILGEVANRGFYRHLRPLLADVDLSVRTAALTAAGKVRSARLWPLVMSGLDDIALHRTAATALVEAGEEALPLLISTLADPDHPVHVRSRIAGICGQLGGDTAIAALQLRMDSEDRRLRTAIIDALDRAGYRAPDTQRANIDDIIWQELTDAAWLLTSQDDVGHGAECEPLIRALHQRLTGIRHRCLLLSSFVSGTNVKRAGERLTTNVSQRAYALEVLETTLSGDARRHLLRLFENDPVSLRTSLATDFTQRRMPRAQRLALLVTPSGHRLEPWIRSCALYAVGRLGMTELLDIAVEALNDKELIVRQTAAWAISRLAPTLWQTQVEQHSPDLPAQWLEQLKHHSESSKESLMFLTVEKVMILRSVGVFTEVPEEVLADLAGYLEQLDIAAEEPVYGKGELGRTMYIVAEGRVRVHNETHTFVELGPGEFFGELTTLDPEPHSASVTAIDDTQLLALDRDALYELMATHSTVLRGLIHTLCQRLRDKGRRH